MYVNSTEKLLKVVAEIFVVIVKSKKRKIYVLSFFDNVSFDVKRWTLLSTLLRTTKIGQAAAYSGF